MVFESPPWVDKLPYDPPSHITIEQFMWDDIWGRNPLGYARPPMTCGLTGKSYSALEVKERIDYLARGLAKEFGWDPNQGSEWDKVIGVFSLNTLDTLTLGWATHRLGGLQTPANAAYSQEEVEFQLKDSGAMSLFTCVPLLETALAAAKNVGIPRNRVYILEMPKEACGGKGTPSDFKTVDQLIEEGSKLPRLEPLNWGDDEGAQRTAFLCYSSGTSGLPKGVMISHRNVIANTLQIANYEKHHRDKQKEFLQQSDYTENVLGLLPFSHIYGLVVICHASLFMGDGIIVLPKFEVKTYLEAIQNHKIATLFIVPPIIVLMTKNKKVIDQYDMSSVRSIFTGAAPLGRETAEELQSQYPSWTIRQGYGLTETCTVVCSSSPTDIWFGSSGCIVPGMQCRLVTTEGVEITGYDQPGELLCRSPSICLGYLRNDKANKETFVDGLNGGGPNDRWMRTGDEAMIKKSPKGNDHIFIVDRIKELIKVKGLQVAPAELEAHLLTHPAVNDCTVIPVYDEQSGEVPKAFVVKSPSIGLEESDAAVKRDIAKHVEQHKARHKWLKGGVEFIDVIPKSPSGKILRRFLRDKEKENRRKAGAKL